MTYRGTPSAWIQPLDCGGFLAAFVDVNAPTQDAPTTKRCPSFDNAKRWIEAQAAAFGLPIEWVDKTTERGQGVCPSPPVAATDWGDRSANPAPDRPAVPRSPGLWWQWSRGRVRETTT